MKLSFDAKRAYHNNRGLGVYSRNVIRLLNEYYPENEYFLFNPKQQGNIEFPLGKTTQEILPDTFFGKLLPDFWRSAGCVKQIKECGADIYHGLSQELPCGIERAGVKTVVTMHDAIFLRFPELYDVLYRKVFIRKNRYACRVADKIIAISEQTKRDFIDFFNVPAEKIEVVYQGCDNIFRQSVSEATKAAVRLKYNLPERFLLNVGAIERRKNLAAIVKALAASEADIDISLVACGNKTPYVDEINALTAKYHLEKRVMLLHKVDFADLPAIYSMAEIFIYPSQFEGFGIPILEALCSSVPVITSRGGCFEETGGDAAMYVDYDNVEEMRVAIATLLYDDDLRRLMIARGHFHAARFTDDKIAANLMRIYKGL